MNKIKIEITPNGWESTVIIDGKEYKEKHVATGYGSVSVEGSTARNGAKEYNV